MSENLDPSADEFRALPLESRRLLSMQPEVRLQGNLMVRERDGKVQVVVPVSLRKRLFEITHNAAHLGSRRTHQQLSSCYYWYRMRQDVTRWYRQCQHCANSKGPPLRPHGQLQKISVGAPMDLVTYLPLKMDPNTYCWSWTHSPNGWKPIRYRTKKLQRVSLLSTTGCSCELNSHVNYIWTKEETLKAN